MQGKKKITETKRPGDQRNCYIRNVCEDARQYETNWPGNEGTERRIKKKDDDRGQMVAMVAKKE